jgi:glycosyltransferase involved in cell wall biosynthesis
MSHELSKFKYSIIIPVFNGAQYLQRIEECLLREHLGANVNIIFVDDGSTDQTKNYLYELALKNSNFKNILLDQNCGQAAARNFGICYAEKIGSDYITFLDVDDEFESGYISNLLDGTICDDADVFVGSFASIYKGFLDPFNGRGYLLDDFNVIDSHEMLLLLSNDRASVSPCNKLIRLSKCPKFPLGVKEEDTLWSFQLFSNQNLVISRRPGPSYKYMIHSSSSTRKFDLRVFDSFWIMREVGILLLKSNIQPFDFYNFWLSKVIGARLSGMPFFLMIQRSPIWLPRIARSNVSFYLKIRTIIRIIYRSILNVKLFTHPLGWY